MALSLVQYFDRHSDRHDVNDKYLAGVSEVETVEFTECHLIEPAFVVWLRPRDPDCSQRGRAGAAVFQPTIVW